MAVLALRTASPWSRFVLAVSWWPFASARSFLASSMSWRVSGLTFPASAFLMVSSACLITTGQLYAEDAEPTRTIAAERIAATTNLMHRHSSLIRRRVSRELSARQEGRLRYAAAQSAGGQSLEDRPLRERELVAVGRRCADALGGALEALKRALAPLLARRSGV